MTSQGLLIVLEPNTPKTVKETLKKLVETSPRFFKQNLLSSPHSLQILKHFKLCNFDSFFVHKTQQESPFLLKSVTGISFPCLKILYLEKVGLKSFEAIHWIDAPYLMVLYLGENRVVNLKSLAKTKFGFIAKMEMDPILNHAEIGRLTRMKMRENTEVRSKLEILEEGQQRAIEGTSLIEVMLKMESCNFEFGLRKSIRNLEGLIMKTNEIRKKDSKNESKGRDFEVPK